jgi:hypothetical protein
MKEKTLIDIDLFPDRDLIHSGYLLKENKHVCILVSFNSKTKKFDGISVFRKGQITQWRSWSKEEVKKIKKDNRLDFVNYLEVNKVTTFYSCLKQLNRDWLVSFFMNKVTDEYYVGKIVDLNREKIKVKLVSVEGRFVGTRAVKVNDIDDINILSRYELRLAKALTH